MCGLVGLFNKNKNGFSKEQQEVFSSLLFIDYLRGPDSTGAILITNEGEVSLAKEASDSLRFLRSKEYNNLMNGAWRNGSAMIGHNRKATRGTVNDENAHPFVVDDNIVLVHNGTLWGDHKKLADVEVDSHAIAHTIHVNNGDVTKALSSIDGAYALIWYDFKNETINLIRNSQRPLWWMETSTAWIWSSEKSMLDFVASRHDLKLLQGPHELPEDTLQVYSLKNKTWDVTSDKLTITKPKYVSTFTSTKYPDYESYVTPPQHHRRHPYANAYEDVPYEMVETEKPLPQSRLNDMSDSYGTVDPPGTIAHFEREMCKKLNCLITKDEWTETVIRDYLYGKTVVAEAFEYTYANQKDSAAGYYLYARVCDDQDIVIRQYFTASGITEERMIQFAGTGYVYEFKIGTKRWSTMAPGAVVGRSAGFVIINSDKATCLYGGGVGDPKYASKDAQVTH